MLLLARTKDLPSGIRRPLTKDSTLASGHGSLLSFIGQTISVGRRFRRFVGGVICRKRLSSM